MKLPRQIMFSKKEDSIDKLTDEKKIKLLDMTAAGGLILGGAGGFSSLTYLSNKGRHQNVPKKAVTLGLPVAAIGLTAAAIAKYKKDKLLKENENKKRKSSK
jgi:uncharacterized membrane protein YebE (DUF533 family)